MNRSKAAVSSVLLAALLVAAPAHGATAQPTPAQRQNLPEIPDVARQDAICFAYYTVNQGVLKLTAQLYPLQDGESREVTLDITRAGRWRTVARTRVTEEPYGNYRQDKTWTAHFRVSQLDNFGRKPVAWLPEIQAPAGIRTPVVQVIDERSGEVVYTVRATTPRFRPWVFAEGSYTVRIGEPPAKLKILRAQQTATR
jgi:hypothetical protein